MFKSNEPARNQRDGRLDLTSPPSKKINVDPMISIAILTKSTNPCLAVAHSLGLAESLAQRGANVTVHSLARPGVRSFYRPVDAAVDVVFHPFPHVEDESLSTSLQRSITILANAVTRGDYDVVHAQDDIAAQAAPGCVRTILRLDHNTIQEITRPHESRPSPRYVCASTALVSPVEEILGYRPPVIPSGVFGQRFVAATKASVKAVGERNQWRTRIPSPFVLSLGGVEPDNATFELLEAVTLAREKVPGLQLVIAGENDTFAHRDYRISLDVRAAELGVQPLVLGRIQDKSLPSLVASCDLFVDFSKTEGFAAAALEALAAGRPVVSRDLPSHRSQLGQLAGYAHDTESLSDALLQAIINTPTAGEVEGQELAATYSWNHAADRLIAYYEQAGLLQPAALG